ncbi:mannitol 1-phosphate dehydrogenase [Byssothecium circinans]|uniref:Mannitol 1-phosphate dehydrogenase n=1 Tax=Byssothecium circinans TaxID=147558 RepID=A0A6A5TGY9_9PLEO|nr:mannitol 1-phosphate dehydrogenase [Byssothecium circinans]
MPTPQPKPYTLAIVGGGISGLVLAIALTKHQIPITIYESAAQFGEIGAGVGFQPNFVRVMERISPALKQAFLRVYQYFESDMVKWWDVRISDRRKASAEGVVRVKDGKSIKLDEIVFTIPGREGEGGGVHRAQFLDELVKLLPEGITQFRKRLTDITKGTDGSNDAVLHFADGTTAQHTAVIGCDGIKSRTRKIVLGEKEARPVFTGKYVYRGLIPVDEALSVLGDENQCKTPQMYSGYHGHVLTYSIANGTIMNVAAFNSTNEWKNSEWVTKTSHEEMLEDYKDWTQTVKGILTRLKNPDVWALFNQTPAKTFFQMEPRVCLLGDAAHASTPHQGSGAGMGIEDAWILSELLAEVDTVDDLAKVFRAYETVRRPRDLKLVETSREAGIVWDMEGLEGVDIDAFERNACSRMAWIWDHDIAADLERAREILRE